MKTAPTDLPGVVKEIASALIDGDWTRYADDSAEHFYYVIREQDHSVVLLAAGADATVHGNDRKSARELAQAAGFHEVATLLENA